jgi:uncharacterized protein YjdB
MNKIIYFFLVLFFCSIFGTQRLSANTILGNPAVCVGGTSALSSTTTGGAWTSDNLSTATVDGTTGIVTGVAAGTATISYDVAGDIATTIVTVSLSVSAGTITGSSTVCLGSTTQLTDVTSNGTWSSSNNLIATVGSTGIVNGLVAGSATIYYSVTNGCGTATAPHLITVNAGTGSAGSIIGTALVCIGSTTALTDAVTGGTWSSVTPAVATIGATGIVTAVSSGTSVISYSVLNSCGTITAATRIVTVNTLASAGTITGTPTMCSGATTALTDVVAGGTWNSAAPTIASVGSTGIVTGIAGGTTTISYNITNSCGAVSRATQVVTVTAIPSGGTITGTTSICTGSSVTLNDVSGGGVWISLSPAVATVGSSSGLVTGVSTGTATISYTVTNSCGSAHATVNVTVSGSSPGIITGATTVCTGATTALTDPVTGGTWSSGTPGVANVGATGIVTGVSIGTTTISYSINNGCGIVRATAIVTVNSSSAGTISGTATLCSGATVALTDAINGGTWSSGNATVATVDPTGIVTGVTNGTAMISYIVTNSCGTGHATFVVNVGVASVPAISGAANVVTGASIALTDATPGGTWTANNGNATVTGSGVVTGLTAGSVIISYSIATSCGSATAVKVITISNASVSAITAYYFYVCVGATADLFDGTAGGIWSINPPDAGIASISPTTGVVTGLSAGIATVSYTLGTSYATAAVSVYPIPSAIIGPDTLCLGSTMQLYDSTPGGTWSCGLPSKASVTSTGLVTAINHSELNIPIYYTIAGALCKATHIFTIDSLPGAIIGPAKVCLGSTITLSDTTRNGFWSGTSAYASIDGSGDVTGLATGTTGITFTSTSTGCTRILTLTVNGTPSAINGNLSVCAGSVTFVSDASTPGISWTSSATSIATVSGSGAVTGVSAGTTMITYLQTNGCGATAVVTVSPTPAAVTAILGPTSVSHSGSGVTLSDLTPGGLWSSSNTAVLSVGSTTGLVIAVVYGGSAYINYTVTNSYGCKSSASKLIGTSASPHSPGVTTTTTVGAIVNLVDEATGGEWASSDNNIATVDENGQVTAIKVGNVNITHATINSNGDEETTVTEMIIKPLPLDVSLVPNPNNGSFTISGTTGSNKDQAINIEVTNMLGQIVYSSICRASNGIINEQLLLGNNMVTGLYLLNLKCGNGNKVLHFVIEK